MKFLDKHEKLFSEVFKEGIPENIDLSDLSDHSGLEQLNPSDAVQLAEYSDEEQNWTTWTSATFYYVCRVRKSKDTYILFTITWDDNWGRWERYSLGAVEGVNSHQTAGVFLLRQFAEENVQTASGAWEKFLKRFL